MVHLSTRSKFSTRYATLLFAFCLPALCCAATLLFGSSSRYSLPYFFCLTVIRMYI